ncbi:GNAT family N-acetyltransferase [Trinickia fusca]|uniref:N-acetyltransferase n=1 Tax=Trinickia fusca TaxID=2419777 RepID=A0A494X1E1_9BURK|nr:GNAT family N-acetyltransferase [Trinickia fusca]RKP44140.1 N-acetyltransferase [Trinickia fusca]
MDVLPNRSLPNPTARLRLRPWVSADRLPFGEMNADKRVMEYFPATLSSAESDALVDRICAHHEKHGFGLWAVELRATSTFIGFTGLAIPQWDAPFAPCVEVGWRLAAQYWGQGYATEAARAALAFGFDELALEEIVSFTAAVNDRSQRVMQRLGMGYCKKEDFDHPALAGSHPLARHVLYRLSRETWEKRRR